MNFTKCKFKKTTVQYIAEARETHGDRYGYPVAYLGAREPIWIECFVHRLCFKQCATDHLKGYGCPLCAHELTGRKNKNSLEEFVVLARKKRGDQFDYSESVYKDNRTPIKIWCKKCEAFFMQRPDNHLNKKFGCTLCHRRAMSDRQQTTLEEFEVRARSVQGESFDYHELIKRGDKTYVVLTCRTCKNKYSQYMCSHFEGSGCKFCNNKTLHSNEMYVAAARAVHGNGFTYLEKYKGNATKVLVRCNTCELEWKVAPTNHIHNRSGCPACYRSRFVSLAETAWLDSLDIPKEARTKTIVLSSNKVHVVDGLIGNIVYEYYGTYYHGDPRKYPNPEMWNKKCYATMGALYRATLKREKALIDDGYEIKFVWEIDNKKGNDFSSYHPSPPSAKLSA